MPFLTAYVLDARISLGLL
jgi:hypothetical protein